jgi:FkbM family methyltransferase
MRDFAGIQKLIRRNFYFYLLARRFAPFLCRYFNLEDGFEFLSLIRNVEGSIAVDVGSNDGTSIALISRNLKDADIYCFDPVRAPLFSHKMFKSISYFPFALGDQVTDLRIFIPVVKGFSLTQYSSSDRKRALNQLVHDLNLDPQQIVFEEDFMKVRVLDDFELSPFFLKVDVEGDELKVLVGAAKTILAHLPIILVEIQGTEVYQQISSFLTQLDYYNFVPADDKVKEWKNLKIQSSFTPKFNNYLWLPRQQSPMWNYK